MWMPAGRHTIIGTNSMGQPIEVQVEVTRQTAAVMMQALRNHAAESPQRPFFDFAHARKEACGWPLEFAWREDVSPGVWARLEWSGPGRDAITGRAYRSFSPTFFVDAGQVIGAPLCMGGLVNDPAFRNLNPIWASRHATAADSTQTQAPAASAVSAADAAPAAPPATAAPPAASDDAAPVRQEIQALRQQIAAIPRLTPSGVATVRADQPDVFRAYVNAATAHDRARVYAADVRPRLEADEWLDLRPFTRGMQRVDAANSLGTLVGALVINRALEMLRYDLTVLSRISTGLSAEAIRFGQTAYVRLITPPAVTSYSTDTGYSSTVNRDTSVFKHGSASLRLDIDASGNFCKASQNILTAGTKYRVRGWVRQNSGSTLTNLQFTAGTNSVSASGLTIEDSTWTEFDVVIQANGVQFGLDRPVGVTQLYTKSLWFDSVSVVPVGSCASFSAWGLDRETVLWRNQALNGDATLVTGPIVSTGQGRMWSDENMLTQISREHRALAGGGVYFDGNASQRVVCVDAVRTAQDIDVTAFWNRVRFTVPTSNPATSRYSTAITSSATGSTGASTVFLYINPSGQLHVAFHGSTPASDYRIASINDFLARYSGKVVNVVLCRTSAGGLLLWVNGVPQAYVESTAGTPPTWAMDVTSTYVFAPATHIGELFTWQLGRGTLTDALVSELTSTGLRSSTAGASPIDKAGKFSATAQDGCVIDLDFSVGVGQQFPDRSGNGLGLHGNSNHTTHSHLFPKRAGQVRGRTSTNGNQQLLGTVAIPTNARITSIVCTASGSATVSIGNASGGAQIASGLSIVSGKNEVASFVARYSTTGNIWISANAAETLDWTINYELVD